MKNIGISTCENFLQSLLDKGIIDFVEYNECLLSLNENKMFDCEAFLMNYVFCRNLKFIDLPKSLQRDTNFIIRLCNKSKSFLNSIKEVDGNLYNKIQTNIIQTKKQTDEFNF